MLRIHVESITNQLVCLPIVGNLLPWSSLEADLEQQECQTLLYTLQTFQLKRKIKYTVTDLNPSTNGIPSIPLSLGDRKVVNIFTDHTGKLRIEYDI